MQKKLTVLVRLHETMQKKKKEKKKKAKKMQKKKRKQNHIQNRSKFLPWYLINDLECTVQYILKSLNTLFELHMKLKK